MKEPTPKKSSKSKAKKAETDDEEGTFRIIHVHVPHSYRACVNKIQEEVAQGTERRCGGRCGEQQLTMPCVMPLEPSPKKSTKSKGKKEDVEDEEEGSLLIPQSSIHRTLILMQKHHQRNPRNPKGRRTTTMKSLKKKKVVYLHVVCQHISVLILFT